MGKREREDNPCEICGHYHKYEAGEVCGECGHRMAVSEDGLSEAKVSAFPTEILPEFLYLGSYDHASMVELLPALGITRILNTVPSCKNLYKNHFVYHSLEDDKNLNFDYAVEFLGKSESEKARVLVHCMSGRNKSPAVVMAYLMKSRGWRLAQSFQWVKGRRPSVQLSQAVYQQLQEYEQQIFGPVDMSAHPSTQSFSLGFPKMEEVPVPTFNYSPAPSIFDHPLNVQEFAFGAGHPMVKNEGDVSGS